MKAKADNRCWDCGDEAPSGICERTDHGDPETVLARGTFRGLVQGMPVVLRAKAHDEPCAGCGQLVRMPWGKGSHRKRCPGAVA
jgi:hypothetical protein